MHRKHARVRDWEVILARAQIFGFRILDESKEPVEAERDGRKSRIDLVNLVVEANDPRDIWLLREAVADRERWKATATYFVKRFGDGTIMPVGLRVGLHTEGEQLPFIEHDTLDGSFETTTLRTNDDISDALSPLAAPNTVGYHRAREIIAAAFERVRPKTWAEIGINDPALIAEFAEYYVTPDHVSHARESGITRTDAIIAAYGLPPLEWVDAAPSPSP